MKTQVDIFFEKHYQTLVEVLGKLSVPLQHEEDLLHDVIAEFLSKPNVVEICSNDGGLYYLIRMIINNAASNTSRFYYKYVKRNMCSTNTDLYLTDVIEDEYDIAGDLEIDEKVVKITEYLDSLTWYDSQLFKLYIEKDCNASEVARLTGIPRASVGVTVNRVKEALRNIS